MSHTLTETDSYDDTDLLVVPDPGDDRKASSVDGPFQQIANHARWLKNRILALQTSISSLLAGNFSAGPITSSNTGTSSFAGPVTVAGPVTCNGLTSGPVTALGRGAFSSGVALGYTAIGDLGGATTTRQVSGGTVLQIGTQSVAGATVRLSSTGAIVGHAMFLHLSILTANSVVIKDDPSGTTLATLIADQGGMYVYDGTNWNRQI